MGTLELGQVTQLALVEPGLAPRLWAPGPPHDLPGPPEAQWTVITWPTL